MSQEQTFKELIISSKTNEFSSKVNQIDESASKYKFEGDVSYKDGKFMDAYGKYMIAYAYKSILIDPSYDINKNYKDKELQDILECIIRTKKDMETGSVDDCNMKPLNPKDFKEDWDDVVGAQDSKDAIRKGFINPLLMPRLYNDITKGLLFYGAPGTGKTYLMKAMIKHFKSLSSSIDIAVFAPTSAELKGKYFGESEKAIKNLFSCASKMAFAKKGKALSVIFIDEVESLAGDRLKGDQFTTTTVNALLQAMDGIASVPNVIFIGITNFPWTLDSAFKRRLPVQIYVRLPNTDDIFEMLKAKITKYRNSYREETVFDKISNVTPSTGILPIDIVKTVKNDILKFNLINLDDEETKKNFKTFCFELYEKKCSPSDINRIFQDVIKQISDEATNRNSFIQFNDSCLYYSTKMFTNESLKEMYNETKKLNNEIISVIVDLRNEIDVYERDTFRNITYDELKVISSVKKDFQMGRHPTTKIPTSKNSDKIEKYVVLIKKLINLYINKLEIYKLNRCIINVPELYSITVDNVEYINMRYLYDVDWVHETGLQNVFVSKDTSFFILEFQLEVSNDGNINSIYMYVHSSHDINGYTEKYTIDEILDWSDYVFFGDDNKNNVKMNMFSVNTARTLIKNSSKTTNEIYQTLKQTEINQTGNFLYKKIVGKNIIFKEPSPDISLVKRTTIIDESKNDMIINYHMELEHFKKAFKNIKSTVKEEDVKRLDKYASDPANFELEPTEKPKK